MKKQPLIIGILILTTGGLYINCNFINGKFSYLQVWLFGPISRGYPPSEGSLNAKHLFSAIAPAVYLERNNRPLPYYFREV